MGRNGGFGVGKCVDWGEKGVSGLGNALFCRESGLVGEEKGVLGFRKYVIVCWEEMGGLVGNAFILWLREL